MTTFHDFEMDSITGESVSFDRYDGDVCLVVNVASKCGLTPQYAGLQQLHEQNQDAGFTVLGFPCNQFGGQEPGTDAEVCAFAQDQQGATFPMFSKIEVNGDGACDLYRWLKAEEPGEGESSDIQWNFEKFLIGRDGSVLRRFSPMATPEEIAGVLPDYL